MSSTKSNILQIDSNVFRKNSERTLREALLKSIPSGDCQISTICKMFALSFGFPRTHCVLEIDRAYLAIGRYGWLSPDFNFKDAEQRDLYETTEFLNPPEDIPDFSLFPSQLQDIRYLLTTPILIEGKRVGFCGAVDLIQRDAASDELKQAIEVFAEFCAMRMESLQKIHLSTQLLLSGLNNSLFLR